MMFPSIQWNLISLELMATFVLVGLVVVDILLPRDTKKDWLGTVSMVAAFGLLGFWLTQCHVAGVTFNDMFVMDSLSWFFKAFFLVALIYVVNMTREFFKTMGARKNEFYLLLWLAFIGMCLVASSNDFLMMFIAIEIMTISLYVMTAYLKSDKLSLEAGMKYLILGALSSGFFLYGISLIYGITHTTNFSGVLQYASGNSMTVMSALALVMVFAAVGFKIASVPFHLWVPDVYQGAPTPVTALLSTGSKAAGFVFLLRLFFMVFAPWHGQLTIVLAVLSAITMTYGNVCAMFQTNIKRLLGYSSIAHAGYLLMGAAAGTLLGASGINFYLLGYLFTSVALFSVVVIVFTALKSDHLDDYAGLAKRSPFLGVVLLLALVSLAGIPPLAGFFGKFALLLATVNSGLVWLALVAAVNIVISLYYYLNVVKRVYADEPKASAVINVPEGTKVLLAIAIVAMITIGIFQGPFMDASVKAAQQQRPMPVTATFGVSASVNSR